MSTEATSFADTPCISDLNLYRAILVSNSKGARETERLTAEGKIKPITTPTGRVLLTPKDAERLFDALCRRRPAKGSTPKKPRGALRA